MSLKNIHQAIACIGSQPKAIVINLFYSFAGDRCCSWGALRQETEARRQQLIEAIQLGRDDVAAGRVEEYTPELLDQIFEEAI